jgi:hypothetical protein
MMSRSRTVIAILVVLLVASLISSGRVHHTLVRGPRAAEGGGAGADDLRKLILTRARDTYAAGDHGRAWAAWREAYAAARAQRDWRGLIDVGDAAVGMEGARWARQSYATSLSLAREQGSVDGVLRSGEAFAGLGDRRALHHAIHLADRLAGDDPGAHARVRDFAAIFAAPRRRKPSRDTTRRPVVPP